MTCGIKILGAALLATLALSAMTASGALAQGKLTSDGNVTTKGILTGAELDNSLTVFEGQTVVCPKTTYTGHKLTTTPHGLIPSGSTAATITPHFGLCMSGGLFPSTVDMNGCDYEYDLKGEVVHEGAAAFAITPTVECPVGKHVIVTMFKNATDHTNNTPFCEIEITEQTDYTNANLVVRNTVSGTSADLDVTGTVNGITAHRRLAPGHSSIFCSTKTDNAAIVHVDVTVKGFTAGGVETGVSISK